MTLENTIEFEPLELQSEDGSVMVELAFVGEGFDGEYDPGDPEDSPLLRYTLYRRFSSSLDSSLFANLCDADDYEDGDWAAVRDGSYCTHLEATSPRSLLESAAKFILSHAESGARGLSREKRLYEKLSWITLIDGQPACS